MELTQRLDVVGAVARRQPARHRDFIEPEYQARPALSFSASPLLGALRSLGLRTLFRKSAKNPKGAFKLVIPSAAIPGLILASGGLLALARRHRKVRA